MSHIKTLAKAINSPFCCGGELQVPKVDLFFSSPKNAMEITFPKPSPSHLEALISCCSPATFGKGTQMVEDKSYRNALALSSEKFATSFHPSEHGILQNVQKLMAPESTWIQAELYKLNIYPEGGIFKSHKDTPRGANMIGSLVVCLPCQHEGGALLVKQVGAEVQKFDFGPKSSSCVQWAALFSDCEHEVQQVIAGFRVTLTYNLYSIKGSTMVDMIPNSSFHIALMNAMQDPTFLPQGGTLGLTCAHSYTDDVFQNVNKSSASNRIDSQNLLPFLANYLKGSDAAIVATCASLGLKTTIHAIFDEDDQLYITERFPKFEVGRCCLESNEDTEEFLCDSFGASPFEPKDDFVWCVPGKYDSFLAAVTASYGNEPSTNSFYYDVVMFIEIPSFEARAPK